MVRPHDPESRSDPFGTGPPPAWLGSPPPHGPAPRPARSPWWIVVLAALITVPATLLLILLLMPEREPGQGVVTAPGSSTDVPAGFVGTWTGAVTAATFPGIPVTARVTITDGRVGDVVGSASGAAPGATCTVELTLVSANDAVLRLEAGPPRELSCPQGTASVELSLRSDAASLVYEESSALGTATGVLRRS